LKRGNILVWEQPLADRLAGVPVDIDARMETQSILYRTLALFGITILAVVATFGTVLWWIVKRSRSADVGHVRQVEQVGR
jgi:nitrate reductase NapE component